MMTDLPTVTRLVNQWGSVLDPAYLLQFTPLTAAPGPVAIERDENGQPVCVQFMVVEQ